MAALDPHPAEAYRACRPGVLHLGERQAKAKGRAEDARRPDNPGSILMRWPWKREAKPIEPSLKADPEGPRARLPPRRSWRRSWVPGLVLERARSNLENNITDNNFIICGLIDDSKFFFLKKKKNWGGGGGGGGKEEGGKSP